MRPLYTAPLLTLLLAASTTAQAQYFFTHLPVNGFGGGWELAPTDNGGVRLLASLPEGGELVLDHWGGIVGAHTVTDLDLQHAVDLNKAVQLSPTERLVLGNLDNGTGVITSRTMFLARLTDGGTTTEATTIGPETNTEWSADLVLHPEGAVVLGRTLFGPTNDLRYRMIVAKFDEDLEPEWGVTVNVLDQSMQPVNAFVDSESGAITCFTLGAVPGPVDFSSTLVKFSASGELLWSKTYASEGNGYYYGSAVQNTDGFFYLIHQLANFNTFDLVLSKVSAEGNLLWSKLVSATQPGSVANVRLHDGALYLVGTAGAIGSTQNALLVKLDLEGQVQSARVYGVPDRLTAGGDVLFTTDADGAEVCWLSGYHRLNGQSPQDVLWIKVAADGTGMDCALPDYTFSTTPTTSTTIANGVAEPYTHFGTRTLGINTFDPADLVYECGAPNSIAETTSLFAHLAPVPTHGPCTLTFAANHEALRIRVLNAMGQTVQEHAVAANSPTVQMDLSNPPAGTYMLLVEELKSGRRSVQRVVKE